jgi:hypothetical protein
MTTENMQNQSPDVGTGGTADAELAPETTTTAAPITTSQVIRKAADILAHKGWCQGYYAAGTMVCAQMALIEASGDNKREYFAALAYMRKFIGALSLPTWNDMYNTTYEDVQRLFKDAANLAELEND